MMMMYWISFAAYESYFTVLTSNQQTAGKTVYVQKKTQNLAEVTVSVSASVRLEK